MRSKVLVSLKDEVLDPAGRALAERLRGIGYPEVKGSKVGRYIELEIETGDREKEKERVDEMCRKLLANEMIEEYQVIHEDDSGKVIG